MDLLTAYSEEGPSTPSDEEEAAPLAFRPLQAPSAAPDVDTTGLAISKDGAVPSASLHYLQDATARTVFHNLPYEDMHAPVVGPSKNQSHPGGGLIVNLKNHRAGHVEDYNMHAFHFDDQYNTFHSYGYAVAPSGVGHVGDAEQLEQQKGESVYTMGGMVKRRKTADERTAEAAARADRLAAAVPGEGWALTQRQPWADKEVAPAVLTEEQKAYLEEIQREKEAKEAAEGGGPAPEAKSHFHGKAEVDFAGRSWLEPPRERKPAPDYCYLPKQWLHTWSGHTKGVNAIRFFPGSGHLLLSAGLDGKVKIWDVFNTQKCMRTYLGHSKGVRDITFSNDGRRFLSSSYDKVIKLWDTETGKVLSSFGEGKMHFCVRLHPEQQNVLLAGCQDKKVYQWDMDSGDLVQEYDYHLAAVNTVTFVDEGRRFVTTSDDKTIRVWEFGIPVQIKYIADPSMHSVPSMELSPDAKWIIGQSLDNQVLTWSTKERFRQNRKKTFKGHTTAGYACHPSFSPDNRYVLSGDGEGKLWVWDWKTCKAFRSIKAHEGVCIDCQWHPLETSRVATAGWDGLIKYWD